MGVATPNRQKAVLVPMSPEQARRAAREAYMRLCIYIDAQRCDGMPFASAPSKRKFTQSQLESGFANYPQPAKREPMRKTSKLIERLQTGKPKPTKAKDTIKELFKTHGPMTIAEVAERMNLNDANGIKTTGQRVYKLLARGELIKHAKYVDKCGNTIHVYALPGTPKTATYNTPQAKIITVTEPKRRPEIVRPIRQIKQRPERPPSLSERVYKICSEEPLTNADLADKLWGKVDRTTTTQISTLTSKMQRRGELSIVGTKKKFGSPLANLYAATDKPPGRQYEIDDMLKRLVDWLKSDGAKNKDQIGEFLGEGIDHRSAISRLLKLGLAHVVGQTISRVTGRPLKLYGAGFGRKGN